MYRKFYLTMSLLSGLFFLAFLLYAGYKEFSPEWKRYQAEYKKLSIKNAKDEAARERAKSLKPAIQQIYLDTLKRADRCTSCHAGVENPLMADAAPVYKTHSGDYLKDHPPNSFGCTICHEGQGRALNEKEAHGTGRETHWDYPIVPLQYVQSSCARCHDFEMLEQNKGERAAAGEKLFREKGCKGCHKLDGAGGVLGNALDRVGSQPFAFFPMRYVKGEPTVYAWHKQHFDDPRKIVPDSEMKITVRDQDSELLTTFILSLKADEIPKQYRRIRQTSFSREEAMDGEALYKVYCIACHTSGKQSIYDDLFKRTIPAIMNPELLKSMDDKFMKKIIEEGRSNTQMTAWKADAAGLSEQKVDKIIRYITAERPLESAAPFDFARYEADVKKGEELYKVRCEFCHGGDGRGGEKILGISLNNPLIQKEADPEFLAVTVRDGRPGTPMATFGTGTNGLGLADQDVAAIVAYVRTLSSRELKEGEK